ncbi:hypothetical protein JCM11641_003547 [Rhodosporidiobolus odoratus]
MGWSDQHRLFPPFVGGPRSPRHSPPPWKVRLIGYSLSSSVAALPHPPSPYPTETQENQGDMSRRNSDSSDLSNSSGDEELEGGAPAEKKSWTMRSLPSSRAGAGGGVEPGVKPSRKPKTDRSKGNYAAIGTADDPPSRRSSKRSSRRDGSRVYASEPKPSLAPSAAAGGAGEAAYQDYPDAGAPGQGQGQPQQYAGQSEDDEEMGQAQRVGSQKSGKSRLKWALIAGAVVSLVIIIIIAAVVIVQNHKSTSEEDPKSDSASAESDHAASSGSIDGDAEHATSGASDHASASASASGSGASEGDESAHSASLLDSLSLAPESGSASGTATASAVGGHETGLGGLSTSDDVAGGLTASSSSGGDAAREPGETGAASGGGSDGASATTSTPLDPLSTPTPIGSATESGHGPLDPLQLASASAPAEGGEGVLTTATLDSLHIIGLDPTSTPTSGSDATPTSAAFGEPGDIAAAGSSPVSGFVMPSDAVTMDPMVTDESGNLVFTFTTSLPLGGSGVDSHASASAGPGQPTGIASAAAPGASPSAGGAEGGDGTKHDAAGGPPPDAPSATESAVGAEESGHGGDVKGGEDKEEDKEKDKDQDGAEKDDDKDKDEKPKTAMGEVFNTTAIFYSEVDWVGACGEKISDDSPSIALPLALYPKVGEKSSLCGQNVIVRNPDKGTVLNLTVLDASNRTDYTIFTPSTFEKLGGDKETGELFVEYRFLNGSLELPTDEEKGKGEGGWEVDGKGEQKDSSDDTDHKDDDSASDDGAKEIMADPKKLWDGNNWKGRTYTGGMGTYYYQKGNQGACGTAVSDSSKVVALPSYAYGGGRYCGKKVEITRMSGGSKGMKVTATVMDECPSCTNSNSLDLSVGAYKALGGTQDEGQFDISWKFIDADY